MILLYVPKRRQEDTESNKLASSTLFNKIHSCCHCYLQENIEPPDDQKNNVISNLQNKQAFEMKAFFISYLLWQIALIVQVGADQNQDQEDPPGECVIDAQTGVCETNNPDNTVDNEPQAEQTLEDNNPKCMEWAKLGECFVNTR